jgi:hypothetical protein
MRKIYAATDNNGELCVLTTSKRYAKVSADSHYKDESQFIIFPEDYLNDTPVVNGKGMEIGILEDFLELD